MTFIDVLPSPLNSFPRKPHRGDRAGHHPAPTGSRAAQAPRGEVSRPQTLAVPPPFSPQNFSRASPRAEEAGDPSSPPLGRSPGASGLLGLPPPLLTAPARAHLRDEGEHEPLLTPKRRPSAPHQGHGAPRSPSPGAAVWPLLPSPAAPLHPTPCPPGTPGCCPAPSPLSPRGRFSSSLPPLTPLPPARGSARRPSAQALLPAEPLRCGSAAPAAGPGGGEGTPAPSSLNFSSLPSASPPRLCPRPSRSQQRPLGQTSGGSPLAGTGEPLSGSPGALPPHALPQRPGRWAGAPGGAGALGTPLAGGTGAELHQSAPLRREEEEEEEGAAQVTPHSLWGPLAASRGHPVLPQRLAPFAVVV